MYLCDIARQNEGESLFTVWEAVLRYKMFLATRNKELKMILIEIINYISRLENCYPGMFDTIYR